MSNKKITMMKLKRIIQMLSDGKSQNEICRETSSSKKTVSGRVFKTGIKSCSEKG